MGPEDPRPQGQARPLLLAPLALFVLLLRQWLPLLASVTPAGRLATSPRPSSY